MQSLKKLLENIINSDWKFVLTIFIVLSIVGYFVTGDPDDAFEFAISAFITLLVLGFIIVIGGKELLILFIAIPIILFLFHNCGLQSPYESYVR